MDGERFEKRKTGSLTQNRSIAETYQSILNGKSIPAFFSRKSGDKTAGRLRFVIKNTVSITMLPGVNTAGTLKRLRWVY